MRKSDEGRGDDQPPAPRRHDGLRALPGPAVDRAVAEGRPATAAGALGLDAQYRPLVSPAADAPAKPNPLLAALRKRLYISPRPRSAHRLAVRTPPFHGGNRGSIPRGRASK